MAGLCHQRNPFLIVSQQLTGTVPSLVHPRSALSPRAGLWSVYLCVCSSTSTVTPSPGVLPRAHWEDLPSFAASEKSVSKCRTSNVRDQLQSHFHVTAKKKPRKSLVLQQQHHLAQLEALTIVESGLHTPPYKKTFSLIAFFLYVPQSFKGKKTSKAILYLNSTSLPNLSKLGVDLNFPVS